MTERPKRPLSAYMLWLNETRESIKKEAPGMKVTEIAKRGGELWRAMKDKSVSFTLVFFPLTHIYLQFYACYYYLRKKQTTIRNGKQKQLA